MDREFDVNFAHVLVYVNDYYLFKKGRQGQCQKCYLMI